MLSSLLMLVGGLAFLLLSLLRRRLPVIAWIRQRHLGRWSVISVSTSTLAFGTLMAFMFLSTFAALAVALTTQFDWHLAALAVVLICLIAGFAVDHRLRPMLIQRLEVAGDRLRLDTIGGQVDLKLDDVVSMERLERWPATDDPREVRIWLRFTDGNGKRRGESLPSMTAQMARDFLVRFRDHIEAGWPGHSLLSRLPERW